MRKKLKRIEGYGHGRFLTFSCYKRLGLFGNDQIKQLFLDRLVEVRREYMFDLWAWVIMPEHAHLLVLPSLESDGVAKILRSLKRPVAKRVLQRWRELDAEILAKVRDSRGRYHFWQLGGGYDRNIVSDDELYEKITYIHENPVRYGLVEKTVDWQWSSARWYEGLSDGLIEMDLIE